MKKSQRNKKCFVLVIIIIGLVSLAGHFGYEDEAISEQEYCEMVEDGLWGNYKPEIKCEGVK